MGFDDSASVGSVDLETSLYAADTLSNGQSDKDELESIQSDYTNLLTLSLHSDAVEETLYKPLRLHNTKLKMNQLKQIP